MQGPRCGRASAPGRAPGAGACRVAGRRPGPRPAVLPVPGVLVPDPAQPLAREGPPPHDSRGCRGVGDARARQRPAGHAAVTTGTIGHHARVRDAARAPLRRPRAAPGTPGPAARRARGHPRGQRCPMVHRLGPHGARPRGSPRSATKSPTASASTRHCRSGSWTSWRRSSHWCLPASGAVTRCSSRLVKLLPVAADLCLAALDRLARARSRAGHRGRGCRRHRPQPGVHLPGCGVGSDRLPVLADAGGLDRAAGTNPDHGIHHGCLGGLGAGRPHQDPGPAAAATRPGRLDPRRRLATRAGRGVPAAIIAVVLFLPWLPHELRRYFETISRVEARTTVNALNAWYVVGLGRRRSDVHRIIGPLTPRLLGYGLVLLVAGFVAAVVWLRRPRVGLALPAAVLAMAPFMVMTGMRGRYLLVVLPFLILLALGWDRRHVLPRAGVVAVLVVITQTINLMGYLPPDPSWWPRFTEQGATGAMATVVRSLALVSAIVNVVVFGWLLVSLGRAARRPPDDITVDPAACRRARRRIPSVHEHQRAARRGDPGPGAPMSCGRPGWAPGRHHHGRRAAHPVRVAAGRHRRRPARVAPRPAYRATGLAAVPAARWPSAVGRARAARDHLSAGRRARHGRAGRRRRVLLVPGAGHRPVADRRGSRRRPMSSSSTTCSTNQGTSSMEVAPWAITMCTPGGEAWVPRFLGATDPHGVAVERVARDLAVHAPGR